MDDNRNTASANDGNRKRSNNNYYRKKKNYSGERKQDNLPAQATAGEERDNRKPSQNKGYNNYKRYNRDRRRNRSGEETVDDIKKDIMRIEKEIRLEIEEIKMIRV
ncbi:MAG: hypothetical protein BWX78_00788 [Firmicutes bacterium ADurb.Bin099]|jgi:hypothetical protein|nr:MAG: hypothetical protein BWX78_00788 [Firmicutes bacterium ADurb.Bin099]HPY98119.1 hypothetical protein [Clostridia bacterium]HQC68060.1 hypothetical protein [Clostridia bacterium]